MRTAIAILALLVGVAAANRGLQQGMTGGPKVVYPNQVDYPRGRCPTAGNGLGGWRTITVSPAEQLSIGKAALQFYNSKYPKMQLVEEFDKDKTTNTAQLYVANEQVVNGINYCIVILSYPKGGAGDSYQLSGNGTGVTVYAYQEPGAAGPAYSVVQSAIAFDLATGAVTGMYPCTNGAGFYYVTKKNGACSVAPVPPPCTMANKCPAGTTSAYCLPCPGCQGVSCTDGAPMSG